MTHSDARVAAWAQAYSRIDQATQLRHQLPLRGVGKASVPELRNEDERQITGMLTEAELLIKLTQVPLEVAIPAGDWLTTYIEQQQPTFEALTGDDWSNFLSRQPKVVHCYGCGEKVPAEDAYRDGPRAFHYNSAGGGHTCEFDAYSDEERVNP